MKHIALLALSLSLGACGNIVTVFQGDIATSKQLLDHQSSCGAVPRVYSGVMFDFCMLYATPPQDADHNPNYGPGQVTGLFIDLAFSGVMDTVVLPYTIYRQSADGSIEISRRNWKRES